MSGKAEQLKMTLSRLNHRVRWSRRSARLTREVEAASKREGAVPWTEVQEMFRSLQPMQTEHDLVRIGPDFDGGYLVPDDLDDLRAVFSPGVSETLGFDLEMSQRCNHCYLADASVDEPSGMQPNMSFLKKFIGNADDPNVIAFDEWVNANEPGNEDLLLQMDIEGAEYDVLNAAADGLLSRFRIILLELHDFEDVFDRARFEKLRATVDRLNETHVLCHLHSNNTKPYFTVENTLVAPVFEATYIRKDRVKSELKPALVPHPLDQANSAKLPDEQMPKFWQV